LSIKIAPHVGFDEPKRAADVAGNQQKLSSHHPVNSQSFEWRLNALIRKS